MQSNSPTPPAKQPLSINTKQGVVTVAPTVVSYPEVEFDDPLESLNRAIFSFNHILYSWLLIPLAQGYQFIMPDPAEAAVTRIFSNLREPLNALNHLLQAKGEPAGANLGRFLINSTIGVLGIFDPAQNWFDIQPQKASLNDTLAQWNVSHGAFIVLPVLGQSDIRNGLSTFTENTFAPITFITESPQTQYIQGYNGFHQFAPRAQSYQSLYLESEDPYLFFRNMYMQALFRDDAYPEKPAESDASSVDAAEGSLND
ncbi:MlaA family lipoprotein [Paraglaciecola aestuariivivens]